MPYFAGFNASLGPTGEVLLNLLRNERPGIYTLLWHSKSLKQVIFDAEQHFIERKMAHNAVYQKLNPRPTKQIELIQYLADREAYVTDEVQREMQNWINNYPGNSRKSA